MVSPLLVVRYALPYLPTNPEQETARHDMRAQFFTEGERADPYSHDSAVTSRRRDWDESVIARV
ncbi:MAG TPA: hypothetical protein VFT29_12505 [Gemmatimonadaceae bacterium]|nr:hypothetical protein [Gemmatimonadaceae bacterium]